MADVFKNFLYAGVGLAAVATDKVEKTVNDLVDKGKVSDKEGKKIIEDFYANSSEKKAEFEEKLERVTERVVSKFDFLKRNEADDLRKRVEELEAKLAAMSKTTTKAKAKKAPASK